MSTTQKGLERPLEPGLEIYLETDKVGKTEEEIEDTERGVLAMKDIEEGR